MSNLTKIFVKANVFFFRMTNGWLGGQMGGQSVLLLHTVGRKSGKPHDITISYYRDKEKYLIVASNWGKEYPPDWFLNLMQNPHSTIQVKGVTIPVVAGRAEGTEYQRLWELVTHCNSQFIEYQKGLTRRIPIVILTPMTQPE